MWIAIGAQRFFEDGHMSVPDDEDLKIENMSYINSCDSISRFINEYCVIDTDAKALKSEVYSAYKKFIEEEKIPKALTKGKFNDEMEIQFKSTKSNGMMYYSGFSLAPTGQTVGFVSTKGKNDKEDQNTKGKNHKEDQNTNDDEDQNTNDEDDRVDPNGLDYGLR